MERAFIVAIVTLLLLAFGGCRAKQLQHDQETFRDSLLDMETNQIVDNLIRAKLGLPIVHVDYDRVSGTVTHSGTADVRGSYTDVVAGAITRMLSVVVIAKQDNQLAVNATPVRDKPGIYLAYLQYLDIEDGLIQSHEPPPPGAAHICREYCGGYYWVPIHRAGNFFELSMRVSGLRDNILHPPAYYELTIRGVAGVKPPTPDPMMAPAIGSQHEFLIDLLEPLPRNDRGTATLVIEGKVVPVSFFTGPGPDGEPTQQLRIEFTFGPDIDGGQIPVHPRVFETSLAGQKIKFYPARFSPEPPKRDKLLEQIRDELNSLRLDNLRQGF
jgi:hypothetical protein